MSDTTNTPTEALDYAGTLAKMQRVLAQKLLDRINSGDATAADFNVARQLLKDNHIQAPPGTGANKPLDTLRERLPFPRSANSVAEAG